MKLVLHNSTVRHPAARAGAPAALRGLDLVVAQGEQLAVIGPSGAGKTTLLQLLACAQRPDQGSLQLDGIDPWALPRRALQRLRGRLFLAPQVPPLPPRQRVVTAVLAGRLPHENLWASLRSLVYPTGIGLAEQALTRFDVADKLFDRVDRLSGGERQRVGLARALLGDVRLLVLDEPNASLDEEGERALIEALDALKGRGATVVTVSHKPNIFRSADKMLVLRDGRVQMFGPRDQVLNRVLQPAPVRPIEANG